MTPPYAPNVLDRIMQGSNPDAQPATVPHARGAVPGPVGGEQPGVQAPPSLPATPFRGKQAAGMNRYRQLVDARAYDHVGDLEAAKRESRRPISEQEAEMIHRDPGFLSEAQKVLGRGVAGFQGIFGTARDLAYEADQVVPGIGSGLVFDRDPDTAANVVKPRVRVLSGEEYFGDKDGVGGVPTFGEEFLPDHPETLVGGIAGGVAQFLGLFLTGNKSQAMKNLSGVVTQIGKREIKSGRWGSAAVRGAVADGVAFPATDPFIGDAVVALVETHPELKGPVSDLIEEFSFSQDPDDSRIKRRFMRSVEGFGIGTAVEGLFLALKGAVVGGRGTSRWLHTRALLNKLGDDYDPKAKATARDEKVHEELDKLESERAADDAESKPGAADDAEPEPGAAPDEAAAPEAEGTPLDQLAARLDAAKNRDPRAARREGRSRTIQAIMDKFGVAQGEADQWYNSKLQERMLPKLMARESSATVEDLVKEIDQWEKELGKTLDEIRFKDTPELNGMKKHPIISEMRAQGGVATVRQTPEGGWVKTQLASELEAMDITPKTHPGLFRDPRKRAKFSLGKKAETPPPKGDVDEFDWTDSPLARGPKDEYGRPVDNSDIYEGISDEVNGSPRRTEEETDIILSRGIARDELRAELDELGIDLDTATNREAVEALHRKQAEAMGPEAPRVEPRAAAVGEGDLPPGADPSLPVYSEARGAPHMPDPEDALALWKIQEGVDPSSLDPRRVRAWKEMGLVEEGADGSLRVTELGGDELQRWNDGAAYLPPSMVGDATPTPTPRAADEAAPRPGPHPDRPPRTQSPGRLEDRPSWELTRAEEGELHDVPASVIRALEVEKGGELGRGSPKNTLKQIDQLKASGFLDEAGELTDKGAETLAGRMERFKKFQEAARRGDAVDRGAARDWPLQIGRAYRYKKAMKPGGKRKPPGEDASDDLSVDEAKSVSEDILNERRIWDEERGIDMMEVVDELTARRVNHETNQRVNQAALDLFEAGQVTRDPSRPLFEQMAELIASRRLSLEDEARILAKYKLDFTDLAAIWGTDISASARQLGALGNLQRAINRGKLSKMDRMKLESRLADEGVPPKERAELQTRLDEADGVLDKDTIAELQKLGIDTDIVKAMSTFRRLENVRRGFLVSQIATAMRNQMTQFGNVNTLIMQEGFERAIKGTFNGYGKAKGMVGLDGTAALARAEAIHPIRGMEMLLNITGRISRGADGKLARQQGELGARLWKRDADAGWKPQGPDFSEWDWRHPLRSSKSWQSEGTDFVTKLLSVFPKHRDMLTSSFNADIANTGFANDALSKVEGLAHMLNTFNRFQEHVFRRAAFKAELGRQVEMSPIRMPDGSLYRSIDKLEADGLLGMMTKKQLDAAVNHSLEVTWAKQFDPNLDKVVDGVKQRHGGFDRSAGRLIQVVNENPMMSWVTPFPRFMANSFQWQLNHSPYGLFNSMVSQRGRDLMKKGDYSEVAEGMTGLTMLYAGFQLAESEYAQGTAKDIGVPDAVAKTMGLKPGTTIDMRVYAPFYSYYWAAHTIMRMFHGADDDLKIDLPPNPVWDGNLGAPRTWPGKIPGLDPVEEGLMPKPLPSYTAIVQAVAGANVRAGLGLYVIDQFIKDMASVGSSTGGMGATAKGGGMVGSALGNVVASYMVPLNPFWDSYKSFKQWQGDMEPSKVRDVSGPAQPGVPDPDRAREGGPMPLGFEKPFYEAGLSNFWHAGWGEIQSRIPPLASRRVDGTIPRTGEKASAPRYPELELATQRGAAFSYAPLYKALFGFTFKDPKNMFGQEVDYFGLSQSDILPSSGNDLWDRSVARHMGEVIEEKGIPAWISTDTYQNQPESARLEALRVSIKLARTEAVLRAGRNQDLRDLVMEQNADYRRLIFEEGGWASWSDTKDIESILGWSLENE